VLRNIHPNITTDFIKEELNALGHRVRKIMNIRHRIHKTPLPLFFVDLVPALNNKDIYEIKYIQNMRMSVEPPRKNNSIIQCTRCQSYGHRKTDCRKSFRRVKCAGDHNTNTCTKLRTTSATCALCGGVHTANYKGCDIYQKLQAKRRG
jgi:ribosomal protein S27E